MKWRRTPKGITDASTEAHETRTGDQPTESDEGVAAQPAETVEAASTDLAASLESGESAREPGAEHACGKTDGAEPTDSEPRKRPVGWCRLVAYGILPALAFALVLSAGFLKWQVNSAGNSDTARAESVQTAKDSTMAILSYQPDTADQQLNAAGELLTGTFRDSYSELVRDVVIPGAQQKQISAVATVPAAASVSADAHHAVVLVFVNQTVIIGQGAPTETASSVRVELDKVDDRWLISKFDPI
ncbi:hypothetical protein [Mycobacterium sp. DBP42]|uniref:hypothetical protein n=1 Tax=Mycobacterium sp. DBP42 TaxID=2545267 RepID=UPI002017475E|nr:hypothetical protein [Mycobacterium sp. DBP42]